MKKFAPLLIIFVLIISGFVSSVSNSEPAENPEGYGKANTNISCDDGAWQCSNDAYTLLACKRGVWETIKCMRGEGRLCENGACVEPWRYGAPEWPRVESELLATPESLAEKARFYEDTAVRLHLHPELKWFMSAELPCKPVECGPGREPPCEDCSDTAIPVEEATWKDVVRWYTGENDGLFSALYLAAEAFRYGTTGSEEALGIIKLLMEGQVTRMEITGVPGIFTRQFVPPGVPGISCPEDKDKYMRDREKDDNRWVKVGDDGCVWYVDDKTGEWTGSTHCGLEKYAGWCWLDNVSKDEYSGHMFALGVVAKLVDDPEVQGVAKDLLYKVGKHLVDTGMEFTDWDGRVTEHGRIHAITFGDYPGFNAAMGLDFIKIAAEVTGENKLDEWYENCLLQKKGKWNCLKKPFENPKRYTKYLELAGMYPGFEGCKANYNNISMHMLSMHNLIWFERDPQLREIYQHSLDADVFRAEGQPRAVMNQNNAFFDFIWASQKRLGPGSGGPAYDAVENAIRMLRQFPARQHPMDISCPQEQCTEYCRNRFDRPTSNYPRPIAERCPGLFIWWRDPYSLGGCKNNSRIIYAPTDYLLAYWMGRYYGFIAEDM